MEGKEMSEVTEGGKEEGREKEEKHMCLYDTESPAAPESESI